MILTLLDPPKSKLPLLTVLLIIAIALKEVGAMV